MLPPLRPCVGGAAFNTAIDLGRQDGGRCFPVYRTIFMVTCCAITLDAPAWIIRPQPARRYRPRWPLSGWKADRRAIIFYDENSAGRMLTESDLPTLGDDGVSAVLFGCISLIAEPCGSVYEALMVREAPRRDVPRPQYS